MNKKTRAWMIAISGTVMTGTIYAAIVNCFSLFIIPICTQNGFSRGSFNISLTLLYCAYMVGSIMSGKLFRRYDLKKLMLTASILMPILFGSLAFTTSLFVFYIVFIILGLMMPYVSFAAYSVLIHDWFEKNEGTAVGIAFMGSGIGGMILNVISASLIENRGYQFAFIVLSIMLAAVAIPVTLLLVKPNHENYGVDKNVKQSSALFIPGTGKLMALATAIGFGITIMSQTMPPHLYDLGFSQMYAASMNSLFMGGLCLAKLIMGWLYDRLGVVKTIVISCSIGIIGALSYLFGANQILHPTMIIGAAMATALGSVSYPVLARYLCKEELFASASGNASAFNFLGSSIAPFFMNYLYDITSSYSIGYVVSIIMLIFVCLVIIKTKPTKA